MSSLGKSWSEANAACPRPEHAGSRVRFAGRHGPTVDSAPQRIPGCILALRVRPKMRLGGRL